MIEEHNMRAQARRDSRTDMLRTVTVRIGLGRRRPDQPGLDVVPQLPRHPDLACVERDRRPDRADPRRAGRRAGPPDPWWPARQRRPAAAPAVGAGLVRTGSRRRGRRGHRAVPRSGCRGARRLGMGPRHPRAARRRRPGPAQARGLGDGSGSEPNPADGAARAALPGPRLADDPSPRGHRVLAGSRPAAASRAAGGPAAAASCSSRHSPAGSPSGGRGWRTSSPDRSAGRDDGPRSRRCRPWRTSHGSSSTSGTRRSGTSRTTSTTRTGCCSTTGCRSSGGCSSRTIPIT